MESSGLVHLNSRFYNPGIGRFITQDTYKGNPWQPWTQNLYTYVGNNPVNYVDPTGHMRILGFSVPSPQDVVVGTAMAFAIWSTVMNNRLAWSELGDRVGDLWDTLWAKTAIDVTSVESLTKAIETDSYTVGQTIFKKFRNDCNKHGAETGVNPNGGECTNAQAAAFIAAAVANAAAAVSEDAGTIIEYTYQQGEKMTAYIYDGFVTVKNAAGVMTGYWAYDADKMAQITRDGFTVIKGTYP